MENAALVCVMDGFRDGFQTARSLSGRQRLLLDELRQTRAIDAIHHNEVLTLVETDFMDSDDARMLERAGCSGFGAKAADQFRAGERAERKHFDSDTPVEASLS